MKGVGVQLDDCILPCAIGAVDGYFRGVSPVKCGIEFAVVDAASRLAARMLQTFVICPVVRRYKWKFSTQNALCASNHVALYAVALISAVSIGCLGRIPACIIGVFIMKYFVGNLTDTFKCIR